jgi:DNA (cytosine-5)-methyltransferase 1
MKNINQYSVIDLFCGTGALSHGLMKQNNAYKTVAGIDLEPSAVKTASANHKSAYIFCEKIENIAPDLMLSKSGVDSIDLIVGGPPCQGFSSLRPSRGKDLEDPRNNLYKQFIEYVKVLRPTAFLMENVIGLVNAGDGKLLRDITKDFQNIGYSVDWRILNSANFGVPQKRERFFLIGTKKAALGNRKINFPSPTHMFSGRVIGTRHKANYVVNPNYGEKAITVWEAISDLPSLASGEKAEYYRTKPLNDYQLERRINAGAIVTLHETANHSSKMLEIIRHSGANITLIPDGLITSGYSSCYSRLDAEEPSTTITVKFTSPASSKCIHPNDDRSITPREAARIQGFDDNYIFCGSKTDIASQIGNAVPPLFGAIFGSIFDEILQSRIAVEEY